MINAGINKWREKALWKVGKTTSRRFWELEQLAEKRRSKRGLTSLWIFLWHFHLRSWQCCQLTHFLSFFSDISEDPGLQKKKLKRQMFSEEASFIATLRSAGTDCHEKVPLQRKQQRRAGWRMSFGHVKRQKDSELLLEKNGCENFSSQSLRFFKSLFQPPFVVVTKVSKKVSFQF